MICIIIDRVESLDKKQGIKPPLKFKDCREGKFFEDDGKNDDNNGSIAEVDNEEKQEYEPTVEGDIKYNE